MISEFFFFFFFVLFFVVFFQKFSIVSVGVYAFFTTSLISLLYFQVVFRG